MASATTIGRDHAALWRNGQDAAQVARVPGGAVGVVADGCGSSDGSELGARLTAAVLVGALAAGLSRGEALDLALVDRAFASLLGAFEAIVRPAGPSVRPSLLATAVGFCVWGGEGLVFAAGDGVVCWGGARVVLDQDNAPAYPLYALGGRVPVQAFPFDARGPFSLAVGTDGLAPIPGARLDAATREGDAGLLRWLRVERERAPLPDDAAIAVARAGSS